MDHIGLMVSDVSRLLRRRFDERARAIGVTRAQWRTLTALSRQEGINQGRLADLLEIEPISLCRMIDRLTDAGLVERRRDPGDRRAWNIYMTPKARPMLDELAVIAEGVMAAALGGLGPDAEAALASSLARVRLNLTDAEIGARAHG